jgi:tetratricopeptide (TPR) repeat protein
MPILWMMALLSLTAGCSLFPTFHEFHDPLTPAEHLALGVTYESAGNTTLAITEYKKVIEQDSEGEGVTARVFLGNVYAGLDDYPTAEQYYRAALALNPHYGLALNNLAALYVKQGTQLNEAEALARTALLEADSRDGNSRKGDYLQTLGEVLLAQRRYVEALEQFRQAQAVANHRKHDWLAQLQLRMAEAYDGLGQPQNADAARRHAEQLRKATDS